MTSAPEEHRPALTDLAVEDYEQLSGLPGARSFTGRQVRRWVLARGAADSQAMTDLSKELRAALDARWRIRRGVLSATHPSRDGTLGLLTRLDDGEVVETVSIPDRERRTLCLSSQVGCGVGCAFCASGLGGLVRNLSPGEMLEQILVAREQDPDNPPTNFVFMGSGEPTHNWKHVLAAIRVMTHPEGLGIGARRITVSTVGHPAAVRRLVDVDIPFNLALSVHMPGDDERCKLMPGLGSSDLAATLDAARDRFAATGRRLTVEVVVLAGVNDTEEHARRFARLLATEPVLVNLIPWNKVDGLPLQPPTADAVTAMADILRRAGIATTIRRPRGRDVGVACGQLRRRTIANR